MPSTEIKLSSRNCFSECSRKPCLNQASSTASGLSTRDNSSLSSQRGYLKGESLQPGHYNSLSALYRSQFNKFPSFPSIYQTKYQRDYQYQPWTAKIHRREFTPLKDYRTFKIGTSSYSEQYTANTITDLHKQRHERLNITARRNNPQPKMGLIQNHPMQPRWQTRFLENQKSKSADTQRRKWKAVEPRVHRWNSR